MSWWNALTELQKIFASVAVPATLILIFQFVMLLFGLGHDGGADSADGADGADAIDAQGDVDFFEGVDQDAFEGVSQDFLEGHPEDILDSNIHSTISGADAFDGKIYDSGHDAAEGNDHGDALRLLTLRGIIAFFSVGGWMGIAAIDWNLPAVVAVALAIAAGLLALYFVAWIIRAFLRMQQSGNIRRENAVGREGDVYLTIPAEGRGKVNVIVQERLCEMDAVTNTGRAIKTGEKVMITAVTPEGYLMVEPKVLETENTLDTKSVPG